MPSGYRDLAFAALIAALALAFGLGLYVSGLNYPDEGYQTYRSGQNDKERPVAPVTNVAATIVERTPCNQPQSETESDLCAQWRAAKAGERSADWTVYGFWATLAGIALLTWQLILTRKAVTDTGNATEAMIESNNIASRASKNNRAWLTFLKHETASFNDGIDATGKLLSGMMFYIHWINCGATPAVNISMCSNGCLVPSDGSVPPFVTKANEVGSHAVGPNQSAYCSEIIIAKSEFDAMVSGIADFFIFSQVRYDDIHGDRHVSEHCARVSVNGVIAQNGETTPRLIFSPEGEQNHCD
jgi:hypothetical protein